MSFHHSPTIVTDGLVLLLDAANEKCHVTGDSIAKDLSNTGTDFSVTGNATASTNSFNLTGQNANNILTHGNYTWANLSQFTLSFWFKTAQASMSGSYEDWFKIKQNSYQDYWMIRTGNNKIRIAAEDDNSEVISLDMTTSNVYDQQWHQSVITYNDTVYNGYLDNVNEIVNSSNAYGLDYLTYWTIYIGKGDHDNHFDGYINGISLYNKALTQTEITQNYNALKGRFGI